MQTESNMIAFGDSPINGGLSCGPINDMYDMDMNFPDGLCQQPEMEHSTKMAGKTLGLEAGGFGDMI